MKKGYACGLIDAQRGFMPAEEGIRIDRLGFGELPIAEGEQIVPLANKLLAYFALKDLVTFTTQDWHPLETAHFAEEPNFTTTWPVHCVSDTPGARLHPEIIIPEATERFVKGFTVLEHGEDDTSYSGYNGFNHEGVQLNQWLEKNRVRTVVLGGLALDYCVGATALDLRNKMGLDVIVAVDATRAVTPETGEAMLKQFAENDIRVMTTQEVIEYV